MALLDMMNIAEMAYEIANTAKSKTEKGAVTAGLDAEIAEIGRGFQGFFNQAVKDIQQLEALVSTSAQFKQDDSVASQAPVEINYLEMAFALPIATM
ncbi:hypothetical protein [Providencia sp.]|uniref:hypothetical protein n=1 Tax=Providencia sp. TaxID=589 RepID=UPI00333E9DD9